MPSLRYAIRSLLKAPGFSAIAVTTIALGIAANTAIFSVVNGVLLRPLPFRDEARIVRVSTATKNEAESNHSAGDFLDLQRNNRTLEALAGFREDVVALAAKPGNPELIQGAWVTSEFFDVLGAPPFLGRTFTRGQNGAGGEKLVVLSHAAWQQLYGDDVAVAGRRLRVSGEAYTVAAVMRPGFAWPEGAKFWLLSPLAVPPAPIDVTDPLTNRDVQYFQAIGRLKSGVTLADAQQDLKVLGTTIQEQHAGTSGGRDVRASPIREQLVGSVRDALLVIQGAVGLVLLIACANVSSLLIARATGRRRELAIRAALGARRGHLVRQLLTESLVLGLAGGVLGLLASSWLVVLLVKVLPRGLPRTEDIRLDATVMAVTAIGSIGASLLFGILPALQAARTRAAHVIKDAGERGSTRARGRAALVVAEIALTLVLLVGAGLLATSFVRLQRVDPGFKAEHATLASLMVPQSRYPKGADQTRLYGRLLEGLSQRPQLQAVGIGFPAPFHASNASASFSLEGRASNAKGDRPFAHLGTVSGGYFAAMGIPLLAGRTFTERDTEHAPPVADVGALLKSQMAAVDPDLPIGDISSLQAEVEQNVDEPKFRAMVMGTFAVLALVLAAVGVFGLISYTVAQRTREIGIRMALGAAPRQVLIPVIREGLILALAGVAVGLAGAFVASRALTAFLFGVGAADPLTFTGVALLMLAVATAASYIPSRRALKVDPMIALRAE